MAELLKNIYNKESLYKLALDIQMVYPSFELDQFLNSIMDETWISLELKERVNRITQCLEHFLPSNYQEAIDIIDKVVINYGSWLEGFAGFFPTFVEFFGQDEENWNISINALELYTSYASAEFAVRPFIIKHEERMMKQMNTWAKHKNEHVRRLACEGCRPILPWAPALTSFKKDPTPILPILNQLKTDPSKHVRKSVANNLNDISKSHPDIVINLAKEWYGENEDTNWIVKHGCRTLLKRGNPDVLAIFGYNTDASIHVEDFTLDKAFIAIGDDIHFTFTISTKEMTKVRLEYGIDYVKANGKRNRKIFQISEITMKDNQSKRYIKKHSFANKTTRKHYPGIHTMTLIINGIEREQLDFELTE